jgi:1-acyl-sn-glycerol-3-phosphate acyltransferase
MSYIDIIALACLRPFVFVSSVDMHETEFVGMMAELGGSYFVERRNASRLREEIEELAELMRRGFAVAIFPEGTSTNGETILPFRAPFIESARKAGAPVYPLCLKYKTIGGEPFSPENRDSVCWYGDMEFAPHLEKFMDVSETVAEVQVLDYVNPADYKRKELSGSLHEKIFTVYSGA